MNLPDPPFSEKNEQALIGSALQEPDALACALRVGITEDAFFLPAHRTIWRVVFALHASGRPVDTFTITDELKRIGELERIGGMAYLDAVVEKCPTHTHVEYYAQQVLGDHFKRKAAEIVSDARLDSFALADKLTGAVDAFRSSDDGNARIVSASAWLAAPPLPAPDQILAECFDCGTKAALVGPSKSRKSFFLLQLSVAGAAGMDAFLGWKIPAPRRVLYVNLEITEAHFQRRLLRMAHALHVDIATLADRLLILNARGMDGERLLADLPRLAKKHAVGLTVLDPLYKVLPGNEIDQEPIKRLIAGLDRLCEESGSAVLYAHHAAKGESGDKQVLDRASGSGLLGRDVDAMLTLTPHVEEDYLVLEQVARSYAPRPAVTITWDMEADCFMLAEDTAPICRTSNNRRRNPETGQVTDEQVMALVEDQPLPSRELDDRMHALGLPDAKIRRVRARLIEDGSLVAHPVKGWPRKVLYGTPESIQRLKNEHPNP